MNILFFADIHRRLIPRYFRSLFEGNVTKVHFLVLESKENYVNSSVTLECKHASMITHYGKPSEMKVESLLIKLTGDFSFVIVHVFFFEFYYYRKIGR